MGVIEKEKIGIIMIEVVCTFPYEVTKQFHEMIGWWVVVQSAEKLESSYYNLIIIYVNSLRMSLKVNSCATLIKQLEKQFNKNSIASTNNR